MQLVVGAADLLALSWLLLSVVGARQFEKWGRMETLSTKVHAWGYRHLQEEFPPEYVFDDIHVRSEVLRTGRTPTTESSSAAARRREREGMGNRNNASWPQRWAVDPNEREKDFLTAPARIVEDLLDRNFYEATAHPRRNHQEPTRINLSMSLYQLLEVNERYQSIVTNVWMVQDWYDEFLDWDPHDYEMINKTIVPFEEIWIPDTVLYNSEQMDRKRGEAVMNAIVETGYWRGDGRGAHVQLMFPAIYKLSCKMNVRFFPYDQQNCSFIISSWTHDSATIDYHYSRPTVNLNNFVQNDEWTVISFEFHRHEEMFKCCEKPWTMLYAHLVIQRKPLYYIINLVVPTSIITVVAVVGFFTPSSSSSERDEKLYLGINTLLTMSIMMMMVTNQMPNTSNYVPLMSWYYMGIIFVIVFGTFLATVVLFLHARKSRLPALPRPVLRVLIRPWFWTLVLEPPANLNELWVECGLLSEQKQPPEQTRRFPSLRFVAALFRPMNDALRRERQLALETLRAAQEASRVVGRERRRRETIVEAADFLAQGVYGKRKSELHVVQRKLRQRAESLGSTRMVKRQKMMRRSALEWEFLANCLDRCLLFLFALITAFFFCLLAFYDKMFP